MKLIDIAAGTRLYQYNRGVIGVNVEGKLVDKYNRPLGLPYSEQVKAISAIALCDHEREALGKAFRRVHND